MAVNLRRKDTTKGPPLRVLSLDGGGVRGYSMLIILQELMYRTYVEIHGKAPRRHEIPKPCDHFDLIAGTGTGGLIAIMLGRLRLDIDTCKDVYVRMTKRVFETDKTIAGIPYRSTLFKASRLEWAIQECVREHTISETEGNDNTEESPEAPPLNPAMTQNRPVYGQTSQRPTSSVSVASGMTAPSIAGVMAPGPLRWGNPNASLYDARENRTKTAVTAVYKGTSKGAPAALLRSYDSRKEPPPENNCTIWQAGRATCATGLAFKPIQIGQSMFIDEGAGRYNPAPQILDEAAVNEWPGRDVGVFLSIGTGKRPAGTNHQQSLWWEGFVGSAMGDFAEARRRLISKIEGCEETHQFMLHECLSKRGVNPENYFRLNVEVGVGDFGMNEWNRLAEISTSTRRYLTKTEVQRMNVEAATRLGKIHRAIRRQRGPFLSTNDVSDAESSDDHSQYSQSQYSQSQYSVYHDPLAAELPGGGDLPARPTRTGKPGQYPPAPQYHRLPSANDKYTVISSDEFPQPTDSTHAPSVDLPYYRTSGEYHPSQGGHSSVSSSYNPTPRRSGEEDRHENAPLSSPPPRPPKTPMNAAGEGPELPPPPRRNPARLSIVNGIAGASQGPLPYPDTDGPPPAVNMARKPEYGGR